VVNARVVAFSLEKAGSSPEEWEDGVRWDVGDPTRGRWPRFVVADGATEAFDSIRWVNELVGSFIAPDGAAPALDVPSMQRWFETVQHAWVARAPAFANVFEERKFAEGSYATFLGCELVGTDGPTPCWHAVALGDTVLFHVRQSSQLVQFPPIDAGEFGLDPDGVHTNPAALPRMVNRLLFAAHDIRPGDLLFLATDALAEWIVRARRRDERRVWRFLADIRHPDAFTRFVERHRAAREMKNDDVTLLRVLITDSDPEHVVVCL
jgi:hypothetical protein